MRVPVVLVLTGVGVTTAVALMGHMVMRQPKSGSMILISFEDRVQEAPTLNFKTDEVDPTMLHPAVYIAPVPEMPIEEMTKQALLADQQVGVILTAIYTGRSRQFFARRVADPPNVTPLGAGP